MEIVSKSVGDVPLLEVTGDIDHLFAESFDAAVRTALEGRNRLLVDLTGVDYMDSGGLAVFLWVLRDLRMNGWLGVIGCNDNVAHLFEIVGILSDRNFRRFASLSEATAAVV